MNNNLDIKVVTFKNISDFDFTPALGAMFNGQPIFGKAKPNCIATGEELLFPYHIGNRLAINLAKQILVQKLPKPDYGKGDPAQVSMVQKFNNDEINKLVAQILISEYLEEKQPALSEDQKMLNKVDELNNTMETMENSTGVDTKVAADGFKDKQEVIAELEKREIPHDKRKSKKDLEKLLA